MGWKFCSEGKLIACLLSVQCPVAHTFSSACHGAKILQTCHLLPANKCRSPTRCVGRAVSGLSTSCCSSDIPPQMHVARRSSKTAVPTPSARQPASPRLLGRRLTSHVSLIVLKLSTVLIARVMRPDAHAVLLARPEPPGVSFAVDMNLAQIG